MKKIDLILAGKEEPYAAFITRLEEVLTPFALVAVGKLPIYNGEIAEEVGAGTCANDCHYVFKLNGNVVAIIGKEDKGVSLFGGESRILEDGDYVSVIALVAKLEEVSRQEKDPMKALLDHIISDMPEELRGILGKAAMAAIRRNESN